ncbi:MAG: family 43 glycosylhydrolase [Bacteroidales bacterium]
MKYLFALMAFMPVFGMMAQSMQPKTYCNPLNIDYTYMVYNSADDKSYRSGADPSVVEFRGEYYMFVTRSMGYWHSKDLLSWDFIQPEKWYFEGSNAPTAWNYKDSVLYVTGNPSGNMSILYTDNPKKGDWKAVPSILYDLQDPMLFIDDDGQAYMFWGSSNTYPLRGKKLNKNKRFLVDGPTVELFKLDMDKHGWERFGENHSDTTLAGYMEGAWLTKHNGKYYMQYSAPGTEFNVYADGVYVADHPLGPYTYAPNNPISYKPGGWMNGAGHGSTVVGPGGHYWHFASMALSANVNWERRLCMFPTYLDKDGLMYSDTNFGDYPHYAPAEKGLTGEFTGWMLVSYNKPVSTSSEKESHSGKNLTDEQVKTFWLANGKGDNEWAEVDLQKPAMIHAVQVNYYDYKSDMFTKDINLRHRYTIEGSLDGKNWFKLVDRARSYNDRPNDYVEVDYPQRARYVRYRNIEVPTPNLAISDIRVFGLGEGKKPAAVQGFKVERLKDRRDAMITWKQQPNAQGYNIRWGIAPDKMYSSWLVYNQSELLLKSLTVDQSYYFAIEAFNENGVSVTTKPEKIN